MNWKEACAMMKTGQRVRRDDKNGNGIFYFMVVNGAKPGWMSEEKFKELIHVNGGFEPPGIGQICAMITDDRKNESFLLETELCDDDKNADNWRIEI